MTQLLLNIYNIINSQTVKSQIFLIFLKIM